MGVYSYSTHKAEWAPIYSCVGMEMVSTRKRQGWNKVKLRTVEVRYQPELFIVNQCWTTQLHEERLSLGPRKYAGGDIRDLRGHRAFRNCAPNHDAIARRAMQISCYYLDYSCSDITKRVELLDEWGHPARWYSTQRRIPDDD